MQHGQSFGALDTDLLPDLDLVLDLDDVLATLPMSETDGPQQARISCGLPTPLSAQSTLEPRQTHASDLSCGAACPEGARIARARAGAGHRCRHHLTRSTAPLHHSEAYSVGRGVNLTR